MPKFIKKLLFRNEAREKLLEGVNILADAVSTTLGPRGRNVAINNIHTTPTVLHDGVSVARAINLEDPFVDMGADLLKEAAVRTNEVAGDGTTTSTILAQSIVNEAQKRISTGINPMVVKDELQEDLAKVLKQLQILSNKVKKDDEIEQVATISSGDSKLGKLVSSALQKVGQDGVVTTEEGQGIETTVEYKQGMEIDRGYLSPYFVTDQDRVEAVIEDVYILITDMRFTHQLQLEGFLKKFLSKAKNLLIFASEVSEEALALLVVNKLRGTFQVCAVTAPAYGGRRTDELEDIATLTGGTAIMVESGRALETIEIEELGRADKIVSDRDKTIIIGGKGKRGSIDKRIKELKEQVKISTADFDRDIKRQRAANLKGQIAIINVGGVTDGEVKEKKERVIDAVNATRAAIEEGVVSGGEITLYTLSRYATGILKNALKSPLRKLLENAGIDYAEALQDLQGHLYPYGIDVTDGKVKNLIKEGIIDPVKVTRSALENAVSVATLIITTDVSITDIEEKK